MCLPFSVPRRRLVVLKQDVYGEKKPRVLLESYLKSWMKVTEKANGKGPIFCALPKGQRIFLERSRASAFLLIGLNVNCSRRTSWTVTWTCKLDAPCNMFVLSIIKVDGSPSLSSTQSMNDSRTRSLFYQQTLVHRRTKHSSMKLTRNMRIGSFMMSDYVSVCSI